MVEILKNWGAQVHLGLAKHELGYVLLHGRWWQLKGAGAWRWD